MLSIMRLSTINCSPLDPRTAVVICALMLLFAGTSMSGHQAEGDLVEFALRYGRNVRTTIPVLVTERDMYVDVQAFAEALGGSATVDGAEGTIRLGEDSLTIDITEADSASTVRMDGALYASTTLLRRMAPLRIDITLNDLTVALSSSAPLPVDRAASSTLRRARLRSEALDAFAADTVLLPDFTLLGGGTANYRVWSQHTGRRMVGGLAIDGGMALAGGALDADVQVIAINGAVTTTGRAAWSYRSPRSAMLSTLDCGLITDARFSRSSMVGMAVSNAPTSSNMWINRREVSMTLGDGYEADLYVGRRYVGSLSAAETSILVPSQQGTSYVTAEVFGPDGTTETRRLPIRNEMDAIGSGRVVYDVAVGRDVEGRGLEGHGQLRFAPIPAVMTWLSGHGRMEDGTTLRTVSAGASIGLSASTLLRASWAAGQSTSVALSTMGVAGSSAEVVATVYGADAWRLAPIAGERPRSEVHRVAGRVRATLPLTGAIAGSLSCDGGADLFGRDLWIGTGTVQATATWNGITMATRFRGDYDGALRAFGQMRMMVRLPYVPWLSVLTDGTTLRADVGGALSAHAPLATTVGISRTITLAGIRMNAGVRVDAATRAVAMTLEAATGLGPAMVQTSTTSDPFGLSTTAALSGNVRFDDATGSVLTARTTIANTAGIAMRFFVDDNGNGSLDSAEEIVEGIQIGVDGGTMKDATSGYVMITDLPAATEFMVSVDASTIPDPALALRHAEYSVVTEAHHIRAVDIPLERTPLIDGRLATAGGSPLSLRGTLVRVRSASGDVVRTVKTTRDGSFNIAGLVSGTYTIEADGFAAAPLIVRRGATDVSCTLVQQ